VRRSADAREFDLREQLDQKMLELSELRARAEARPQSHKQAEPGELNQVSASAANGAATPESRSTTIKPVPKQEPAPVIDQTEKTIQNLLKSMEEKLKQPDEMLPAIAQESPMPTPAIPADRPAPVAQQIPRPAVTAVPPAIPGVAAQTISTPPPANLPQEPPRVATPPRVAPPPSPRPSPSKQPATSQRPAARDEWQEFAASLEALRRQSK
jgi:hypothetical protein